MADLLDIEEFSNRLIEPFDLQDIRRELERTMHAYALACLLHAAKIFMCETSHENWRGHEAANLLKSLAGELGEKNGL